MTVEWNPELTNVIMRAAAQGVVAGTEMVRNEMIRTIMRDAKTGRYYTRGLSKSGKSYKLHRASAPGESPANDTGHLVSTITTRYEMTNVSARGFVNVSAAYAYWLEYGTKKMAARPYARVSLAKMQPAIQLDIRNRMNAATQRFNATQSGPARP